MSGKQQVAKEKMEHIERNKIKMMMTVKPITMAMAIAIVMAMTTTTARATESDALSLTLTQALVEAHRMNPDIAAAESRLKAERARIRVSRSLSNPRIGLMRENNLTSDQEMMGPMTSISISQDIMFPSKYFLMGSAREASADSAARSLENVKLMTREKVLSAYAGTYSARKILSLLMAQRESLREIARIAEARRATGAVPQQDEMKAHVEQTKIENEILMQQQEVDEKEAMLNALLGRSATAPITIIPDDLPAPALNHDLKEIERLALENSRALASGRSLLTEAETMKTLAGYSYAPDFMLSFRKPIQNARPDAYEFGIEMTIPLWFFSRQTGEVAEASARAATAKSELDSMINETRAQVRALTSRTLAFEKMIRVYDTALIPQASSSLNSSRTAYIAGKAGFLELLDAERSLYEVRIGFHRALSSYIDNLARLERVAGVSLSALPFDESANGTDRGER